MRSARGDYLHSYLCARARKEGTSCELSAIWFREHLESGIRHFFGITVDDSGFPLSDEQEPEPGFLDRWKASIN